MKVRSLRLAATVLDPGLFPNTPFPEIAVAGRSNVGKSSLLNTLLGRRNLARVSKEPGKTRTVNFYLLNDRFYLVDLPGYGYAKVAGTMRRQWRTVIEGYLGSREALVGVVHIVDARHAPTAQDIEMFAATIGAGVVFVIVLTKIDKVPRARRARALHEVRELFEEETIVGEYGRMTPPAEGDDAARVPVIFFSSKTGEGKEALWRWAEETIDAR
ncbi:MAG: YihA family ribosome biogenesis GTP-binding protein [Candidatus Krumholzibacteriota bacterium]|nr:YihA family ribosome biogenesis GTP-binding protein [Candidatus Krumholzibacteriota bacterium]